MSTTAVRLIPNPQKVLSQRAWLGLAKAVDLPVEARHHVNCAISLFDIAQDVNYSPATTKKSLRELAALSSKFRGGLQKLSGDSLALEKLRRTAATKEDFKNAMSDRFTPSSLTTEITNLEQFESLLKSAADTVADASPGRPKALKLAFFVKLLDEIHVKFTGKHLRRDSKGKSTGRDFIAAVCNAAGLKVGRGSIDEALKKVIKGRGGITSGPPS